MTTQNSELRTQNLRMLAVLFAMTFPTLATWSYLLALAEQGGHVNVWQQAAYVAGKIIQFAFPLLYLAVAERRIVPALNANKGELFPCLRYGLAFGLLVVLLMLGIYFGALRGSQMFQHTSERLHEKLGEFNMATPARYVFLAGLCSGNCGGWRHGRRPSLCRAWRLWRIM
jgi:CAAX protease family protein